MQALNVFLCHSSGDKPAVRELYERLKAETGIQPWLDEEDLLPGQNWDSEIRKAKRTAHVVVVCLSRSSIDKTGYVQKEIKHALDIADQQPDGTIFLIPLKLEECNIPERLRLWHWVSLYEEKGYERLMRSLKVRAQTLEPKLEILPDPEPVPPPDPPPITFPKPDLVPIPSRDFSISRHEITFAQYDHFAKETGTPLPDDRGWGRGDRPVINVNVAEAQAYAKWLSEQLSAECRLPSEEEWEYAAWAGGSGDYGLGEGGVEITRDNLGEFAWFGANSGGRTQPVGTRKPNAWGLYDMFGNVWEWCGNDGTICGGAWDPHPVNLRASFRDWIHPAVHDVNFGFRVVCVPHH